MHFNGKGKKQKKGRIKGHNEKIGEMRKFSILQIKNKGNFFLEF